MDADPHNALTAALRYADDRDWLVFPVPPGTKKSYKSAEHSNGHAWGASRDPMEIEFDFKRWPKAGVGLPTGEDNGFFVLETDTVAGHGVSGVLGLRALEANARGRGPAARDANGGIADRLCSPIFRLAKHAGHGHPELRQHARAWSRHSRLRRHGGGAADADRKRPIPLA